MEAAAAELAGHGMQIGGASSRAISGRPWKRYTDAELLEMYPPKGGGEEKPSW